MNLSMLEEPELEFGGGSRHVDIRFGIKDYGPFDLQAPKAPKEVRIGLIGTAETVEGTSRWIEKCSQGIAQKETKQPISFRRFLQSHRPVLFAASLPRTPLDQSSFECRD